MLKRMYLEHSVLSHGRSDGMQNPMSAMGILDKFMKKKSTEVEEIEAVSQMESFLQQEWQGGGRS